MNFLYSNSLAVNIIFSDSENLFSFYNFFVVNDKINKCTDKF